MSTDEKKCFTMAAVFQKNIFLQFKILFIMKKSGFLLIIAAMLVFGSCSKYHNTTDLTGQGETQGYSWTDLGLPSGTLWATCNVGATKPEDYGYYFAWGLTEDMKEWPGDDYYEYTDTVYDADGILKPNCDAATVKWGSEWHTPTKVQFTELINTCKFKWAERKGQEGYLVTGPSGNSIFLPAAGGLFDEEGVIHINRFCIYWTSKLEDSMLPYNVLAWVFTADFYDWSVASRERQVGYSIRPVCQH